MRKFILLALLICLMPFVGNSAPPTRQETYTAGEIIEPADVTSNEDVIFEYLSAGVDTYAAGSIDGDDLADEITISNFVSTASTGIQPYACTSTTKNTNLNADLVDGGNLAVTQVVNIMDGAVGIGTTGAIIPKDDSIPKNTEGTEFMTLAVTPTSATNKLRIDVVFNGSVDSNAPSIIAALFQDDTANALAAAITLGDLTGNNIAGQIIFTHYMTSGTTSETTFKVRAGPESSATLTFNGDASSQLFGGIMASSITISEITP